MQAKGMVRNEQKMDSGIYKYNIPAQRILLAAGADVNLSCTNRVTPLMLASDLQDREHFLFLLDQGADLKAEDINGYDVALRAAKQGHLEMFKLIIDHVTEYDMTVTFFIILQLNFPESARFLLHKGVNVEAVDIEGRTCLMSACEHGHLDIVNHIISKMTSSIDDKDANENSALIYAARNGHLDVVRALIAAGVSLGKYEIIDPNANRVEEEEDISSDDDSFIETYGPFEKPANYTYKEYYDKNGSGETALTLAYENGHTDVALLLIEAGIYLDAYNHNDFEEGTVIMMAMRKGDHKTVQALIKAGANMKLRGFLELAIDNNYFDVIRAYIDSHTEEGFENPPIMFYPESMSRLEVLGDAIAQSIFSNNMRMFHELMSLGVNLSELKFGKSRSEVHLGLTLIVIAVEYGRIECIKPLIEAGVDINKACRSKQTALMLTVNGYTISDHFDEISIDTETRIKMLETLLDLGADPDMADYYGQTAFMMTTNSEIIKILRRRSRLSPKQFFETNLKGLIGRTHLDNAIRCGKYDTVEYLLKIGANPRIPNKHGQSASEVAKEYKRYEIVKLLRGYE